MCAILEKPLSVFSEVELELALEDEAPPIKVGGSVIWVVKSSGVSRKAPSKYDTGIEFTSLSEEDKQRIEKIVNELYSKESSD